MNQLTKSERMTSIQIAEVTNKPHSDVMKAIRQMQKAWVELGQGNFSLSSYINSQNRAMPMYELSKAECLYIATKFNDTARAKLVLRWQELEESKSKPMSTLDMVQASIDAIRAQGQEIALIKSDVKELKASTQTRPDYFTIAGFATLRGQAINLHEAAKLGRKASRVCKERGYQMDTMPDPRFGRVRLYPKNVLDIVFETTSISA